MSAPADREHAERGLTPLTISGILGAVVATAGIGAVATTPALNSTWYRRLKKPSWQPPGAVFGPVWTVIYALIAASMLVARSRDGDRERSLFVLYGSNLALNVAWTLIFFRGRSPLAAGVEILVLEGTLGRTGRPRVAGVATGVAPARAVRAVDRVCHRPHLVHRGAQLTPRESSFKLRRTSPGSALTWGPTSPSSRCGSWSAAP